MKRLVIVVSALIAAHPAMAFNHQQTEQLKSLAGVTRFIQACDLAAIIRIAGDKNGLRPEHIAVDAIAAPKIGDVEMSGSGGALRSRDKWYQFSFTCVTSADHLDVTKFEYKLGEAIPQDQWASLNLYR